MTVADPDGRYADFADFYAAAYGPLYSQLYFYTGDLSDAQDVVQEAFSRALARWASISTYDDPVAWVRRVAWNQATNKWRRLRRIRELSPRLVDATTTPGPSPDRVAVKAALARLPERQRQAVVLHYLSDMSIAEIAVLTGSAEGTVKSWLHRARITLAEHLGDERLEQAHG